MRVICLYGDYQEKTRERMLALCTSYKEKGFEIIRIGETGATDGTITRPMFGEKTVYLFDGGWKEIGQKGNMLGSMDDDTAVALIWIRGAIPAGIRKMLPDGTKYEKYDIPKLIFRFVENFYPGNSGLAQKLWRELSKNHSAEMTVAILTRQLKEVYIEKLDKKLLDYPGWRKEKLARQGRRFGKEKLERIINILADFDYKAKRGIGSMELYIDLLIEGELK